MFNKRKADDPKYIAKKVGKDITNIRHVGLKGAEVFFSDPQYRTASYEFAQQVHAHPELISVVETLPLETRKVVARSLVTWHGDLITRFGEEIKNDPITGSAALGPDHILNMPKRLQERVINRDGDTETYEVDDYSQLRTWYALFDELGPVARDKILRNGTLPELRPEDDQYFMGHIPETVTSDLKTVREIIGRKPFIYNALSEEFKKDPKIILSVLDTRYSKDAGVVLESLSEEEKLSILSQYRIGWYSNAIPEGLKFALQKKEYLMAILENSRFDIRVLESMDKELLKDPEVAAMCLEKFDAGYFTEPEKFFEAFPKEMFEKAENVMKFIEGMNYRYRDSKIVKEMLDNLSTEEFEKAVRANPTLVTIADRDDKANIISELVKNASPDDIHNVVRSIGGIAKLPVELQMEALVKKPSYYYSELKGHGREFFVEAAMKNPAVIDCIRDSELKSEVIIEYTTIKYLEKKAIKISSEEELDALIKKVKGAKKAPTKAKKPAKKEETNKKPTKK